jgi:hypothetical protein
LLVGRVRNDQNQQSTACPHSPNLYDGLDNEEMKRRYFEAVLKVPLKLVPISADVR